MNFLKAIAKTKDFNLPNTRMNAIDCARAALAFDVLVYASEEKDFNDAQAMDFEALNKK